MKRLPEYSQHFIRSPQLIASLIKRTNLTRDDVVYDIGAGSGIITSVLARTVKRVVAIENEPNTAKILRNNMQSYTNVTVKVGDILTMPLPRSPYKIVANIPFHISSNIVQRFINSPTSPDAAYLIVQEQFGKKLIASDTTHFTGQLGMLLGAEYRVRIRKKLRKTDFWPHPAVETVFIEMVRRPQPLVPKHRLAAYAQYTIECFSDPKKLQTLPLHSIGQSAGVSPSRLSLDQWILLFHNQKRY